MDAFLETVNREVSSIETELRDLPNHLADAEREAANSQRRLDELKETLEMAETNVSLNTPADGKDAETRKMQRGKAVAENPEVRAWKSEIQSEQERLDIAKIDADALRRRFGGMCHIAELKAAQLRIMGTVSPF